MACPQAWGRAQSPAELAAPPLDRPTLADAQRLFYNAHYEKAAALALALRSADVDTLATSELRTSALLFQLKALLPERSDKDNARRTCATCPALIAEFLAETHRGQDLARTTLQADAGDDHARFFLGKLDLNYVWLQLGVLRHKTGWDEYREARRSLDTVLEHHPQNVRARVARAWIHYIVDTRMPWGTKWLLGGGNRKQALIDVRAAAQTATDVFAHAEAEFALWDMEIRERDMTQATEVARRIAHDFPDNREVASFLVAHSQR